MSGAILPLHWAAQEGYNDIIRLLKKYNTLMNKLDKKGYSALQRAYDNDKFETMKILIIYGADPNIFMRDDETLLHHACKNNKYKHVEVLLQNGANVDIQNPIIFGPNRNPYILCIKKWGSITPLHWAAQKGV